MNLESKRGGLRGPVMKFSKNRMTNEKNLSRDARASAAAQCPRPLIPTRDRMIRLLIADDHHLVREGLEVLFGDADDIDLAGIASDGGGAIELAATVVPDVVLMDLSMSPVSGLEATATIRANLPTVQIVALTAHADPRSVLACFDAGVIGFVGKEAPPEDIVRAVRSAANGEHFLDASAAKHLVADRRKGSLLTPRQIEVIALIKEGRTNQQIALALGIAEKTVKTHLTAIYAAIGVSDRAGAAIWARDQAQLHDRQR